MGRLSEKSREWDILQNNRPNSFKYVAGIKENKGTKGRKEKAREDEDVVLD